MRVMQRDLYEPEHEMFRESFRRFLEKEVVPRAEEFEREGIMDRAIFPRAGAAGFLGMEVPEEYGGGGVKDFRYNAVIIEEVAETATARPRSRSRTTSP
jgi:alkylation response protein AidB-like acyl-CoA dehydrogenase